MITADDVRELMVRLSLNQGQLAERLGVSQPTVSRWLRGVTPDPSQEVRLRQMMEALPGGPVISALRAIVDGPSQEFRMAPNAPAVDRGAYPRDVPLRGIAVGGEDADFTLNGDTGDYVRRPPGIEGKRGVYALNIIGTSMEPAFRDGALVYVDGNRVPSIGDDAVIELHPDEPATEEPGRGFIKRVKRIGPSKIIVHQFNPARDIEFERAEIKCFHRVIPWEEVVGY